MSRSLPHGAEGASGRAAHAPGRVTQEACLRHDAPGPSAKQADMKSHHEPEEREDPANAMLDAFVSQVEAMKEMGYGPQLEAKLARLFPKSAPNASENGSRRTARIIADGETALAIAYVLERLRRHLNRLPERDDIRRAMTQRGIGLLLEGLRGSNSEQIGSAA